jgi:tetratricopeptide (TPR) repeat protein
MSANAFRVLAALLLLATLGCGPQWFLAGCEREIEEGTKAIEAARSDGQRALAHLQRAHGYSEKARYSRAFKLIEMDEYERLFALAIADHDHAVELAPDNTQVHYGRGRTYFDRAFLEDPADPEWLVVLGKAEADLTSAVERDRSNVDALDLLGVVHTAMSDLDGAIVDFTRVMALDRHLGKLRLSETYCSRGSAHQKAGEYDPAIADYEKAIELGTFDHGCECQPESPLAWIYYEQKRYDKSWDVITQARRAHRWIAPELLAQLEEASPR